MKTEHPRKNGPGKKSLWARLLNWIARGARRADKQGVGPGNC